MLAITTINGCSKGKYTINIHHSAFHFLASSIWDNHTLNILWFEKFIDAEYLKILVQIIWLICMILYALSEMAFTPCVHQPDFHTLRVRVRHGRKPQGRPLVELTSSAKQWQVKSLVPSSGPGQGSFHVDFRDTPEWSGWRLTVPGEVLF